MVVERDYSPPCSLDAYVVVWEPDPWEEPIDWEELDPAEEYPYVN